MPSVPQDPGVPSIPGNVPPTVPTLGVDSSEDFGAESSTWGVYRDGALVVEFDTFLSIDFRRDWAISDFPLEQGKFESYDKVDLPYNARVRFGSGVSEPNQQALLDSVKAIAGDTLFYQVVTPIAVYYPVNVQHFDYRQTSTNGVGLLVVEMWLQEIRPDGTSSTASGLGGQVGSFLGGAGGLAANAGTGIIGAALSNSILGPAVNAVRAVAPSLLQPGAFNSFFVGTVQPQSVMASAILPAANFLTGFLGVR